MNTYQRIENRKHFKQSKKSRSNTIIGREPRSNTMIGREPRSNILARIENCKCSCGVDLAQFNVNQNSRVLINVNPDSKPKRSKSLVDRY